MEFNVTSVKINSVFNLNSMSLHSIQCQFNEMQCQLKEVQLQFMSIQFQFKFDSISIQCQFIFNIQLQFNEFQIKCKASWFLQSTADLIYTGITLFQLFSPFAGKMEKQLWSLAAFLGECSRIVSQVLDSSDSSSNGNVTQILPANSRRTASNVSSAIERARSRLERSRNRGLCSRLNQRERLPDIPTLPIWLRVSLFVVLSPTLPIVIRSSRVILKF